MRVRTAPVPLVTALLCGLAWTNASAESGTRIPDFAELDADGDGTLDESEWRASPIASAMSADVAAAHYRMYDVDGDGAVSDVEYAEVNRVALERLRERAI